MEDFDPDEKNRRLSELNDLVVQGLGHPLDDDTFSKLADIQLRMRNEHEKICNLLALRYITRFEFLDRSEENFRKMFNEAHEFLGNETFVAIFGEAGMHPEGMIDREAFLGDNK